jgi:hypothetical protein
MSQNENSRIRQAEEGLRSVEHFWQVRLPKAFRDLYTQFPSPFLAPCEFFSLESIAVGAERAFGMLPSFLPFGHSVGEGGLFGFYLTQDNAGGRWPILYWDEDEMFLRPVASDFEAFLRYCVLTGRYETEAEWSEEAMDRDEETERREFGRLLNLPADLLIGPVPGNDAELYERLVTYDPMDAVSLCHLGCVRRARGEEERALDFFHRGSEAAPWFGDPVYLMATLYFERGQADRAVQGWWGVVQRLLPLCTRTWEWDLGAEHPEADIYEVAADGLAQFAAFADTEITFSPLWRVVVHDEPYDPGVRESLGDILLARNDVVGAEREYLNALSLCSADSGRQPERLYDALLSLYERNGRKREAGLVRFDRTLPRPSV